MAEKKTLERVYTIPLRKEYQKAPHYKRAKRAISAIYDFVQRHVKTNDIKIGKFLNLKIWERGIKNPPHHVKVTCTKKEDGTATVELFGYPKQKTDAKETKKTSKPDSKKESKKESHKEKAPAKKVSKADKKSKIEEKKIEEFEKGIEEQKEEKAEIAKEIQKEEIKELKKEHPTFHNPKEETVPKDTHLRKKELIPPTN